MTQTDFESIKLYQVMYKPLLGGPSKVPFKTVSPVKMVGLMLGGP